MPRLWLALGLGALLMWSPLACTAAAFPEREAVVAVIRRYNEELPKATAAWDTAGLQDYLVDRELAVRTARSMRND